MAVVFNNALVDNEKKHFGDVFGRSAVLRSRLTSITRQQYLPEAAPMPHVAIHVRMGDFSVEADLSRSIVTNTRQPIGWYCAALNQLRTTLGWDVPAVVYSDGTDDEISALLAMEGVARSPRRESITDLLSIASASVLIASGSGFSYWGAFLGQVPTLFMTGRKGVAFHDRREFEFEWSFGAEIGAEFVLEAKSRLASAKQALAFKSSG